MYVYIYEYIYVYIYDIYVYLSLSIYLSIYLSIDNNVTLLLKLQKKYWKQKPKSGKNKKLKNNFYIKLCGLQQQKIEVS